LLRLRRKVTAVDLDGDMLRVVESELSGGQPRVSRYAATTLEGVTETSSAAERGRAVGRALRELGIRSRRVVMGLPRAQVMLRTLELPPAAGPGELAAMVRFQVHRDLPFPAAEAVVDFTLQPAPTGPAADGSGHSVGAPPLRLLASVVKANLLKEFLEMARAAGLQPEGIGLRSHANARCVELCRLQPEERCLAVVSLQSNEIIFDVLYDGTLAFSRVGPVPRPPSGEPDAGAARVEQYVQDILMEVVRSLHNYEGLEGHGSICRFLVAGSTGAEAAVATGLKSRFELPAEVLDPVSLLGLKRVEGNGATGAQAAFGLALGALDPGGLPFDFLHPRKPPVQRNTRRLKTLAIAASVAFLFLALTGWRTYLLSGRVAQRSSLQGELQVANQNAKAYRVVRAQAATVRAWEQANQRWLDHVALLSALLPPSTDLYVSSVTTGSRNRINLAVKVRSGEILNRVGDTLREAGYEVRPSAITPVSDRHGYRFQAGVELEVPSTMTVDLAGLEVPARPADDVSQTLTADAEDSVRSGVGAAAPSESRAVDRPGGTPVEIASAAPAAAPDAVREPDSGDDGEVMIVEEPEPAPAMVEPEESVPPPRMQQAGMGGEGERPGRRPREAGTPPGGAGGRGLRSRLPAQWESMSPEERREAIEEIRAARAREGGGVPRVRRAGQP
jgi:Tfp pilus assembly PilM family ATPase